MTQVTAEQLEVTQADRDAAAEYSRLFPELRLPEAFARHRQATEGRMASWQNNKNELTDVCPCQLKKPSTVTGFAFHFNQIGLFMGVLSTFFKQKYGSNYRRKNTAAPRRQDRVSTPHASQAKRSKKR